MITLTTEYTEAPKARAIPGAFFDRESRAWVLKDPTPRGAAVALKLFPLLANAHPELQEQRALLSQEVRPFDFATEFNQPIKAERVRKQLAAEGHDLYDFQAIDAGFVAAVLEAHGGAYLGWAMGLGKTLGTAALIDELDCQQILVVCPNTSKKAVWEPELHRFCPWLEVVALRNSKAQREKDLGYVQQLIKAKLPFALVVHYESLAIIGGPKGTGWNKLGTWDLVCADEAHRISNPKTKMARSLKKIPTKRKLALSGSIIQNAVEELFSPLQWLHPDRYRSKWRDFCDRFLDFVDSGYSRVCVGVKLEKLDELRDELGRFMCIRFKEDELDLPERVEQTLMVDLLPAQRKVYDELVENYFSQLPDGSVIKAADGLALLTRLRQVATNLPDEAGGSSAKLDIAMDLITDNPDEAFLAFSWFKEPAHALAARLERAGIECFVVDGDVKQAQRAEFIERFQSGEGRVFIGTIATLGESVNLVRASSVLTLDRSWNPAANSQALDRAYRIGQTRTVSVYHLVARDTADELRVMPTIREKEDLRKLVLGG